MSPLTRDFVLLCVLMCLSMDNALGVRVRITNDLERNVDLTVHCKSGDDDLGAHVLRPKGSYSFKFGTNFFGGTLFLFLFNNYMISYQPESHRTIWILQLVLNITKNGFLFIAIWMSYKNRAYPS